jgi:hypothetical protein
MPIVASDLKFRLATTSGSAGNSTAQGNPNNSLGKYISTTDLTDNTLNNLFDDVSGDENAAGTVDYRCLFVYNSHGSLTWQSPKIWLSGRRATATGSSDTVTSNAHGFADGDSVRVEAELNTDAIPSGLTNSTTYFVINSAANTFKLAATAGGSAIDIGDSTGFAVRAFGHTTVALGIDTTAASAVGSASAQALTIADENTAPAGVSFSSPTTKATGLSLGNLPNGQCRAVWVKRTPLNNGARNNDMGVVGTSGDTAA